MQKFNIGRAKLENLIVERGPKVYEVAALYRAARELSEDGVSDSVILSHLLVRMEGALSPKTLEQVQADCKDRASKPRR